MDYFVLTLAAFSGGFFLGFMIAEYVAIGTRPARDAKGRFTARAR